MSTSRRNFLKAAGLTFGVVAAGGATKTILAQTDKQGAPVQIESDPVEAHEKKTMFEMLYRNNRTPEQEIIKAVESAPEFKPTQQVPRYHPGDALIPEIWAAESLAILEESMVMGSLVHRDFSNQIAQNGDVINAYKPREFRVVRLTDEDKISVDECDLLYQQVCLDQHFYSSFIIRDGEMSQSFSDIVNIYLAPSMAAIARVIDMTLYERMAKSRSALVICPNGPQDTTEAVLEARKTMNENRQYVTGRKLVVSPEIELDLLRSDILVTPKDRQLDALGDSKIGNLFGFDTFCLPSISDGGVAFHRNSMLLANRPMAINPAFPGIRSAVSNLNDLSMRCVMNYDVASAGTRITFDFLGGMAVLDEYGICRLGRSGVYPGISVLDESLKTVKLD